MIKTTPGIPVKKSNSPRLEVADALFEKRKTISNGTQRGRLLKNESWKISCSVKRRQGNGQPRQRL